MSDAPFAVGQRVRLTPRPGAHRMRFSAGVVVALRAPGVPGRAWWVRVRRDGASPRSNEWFYAPNWEAVPTDDLTLDQAAQDLADAVKRGDVHAALALADCVFELCGGTRRA
jgi:hypothetical protein